MRVAFSILFWTFFVVSSAVLFVGALLLFVLTFPFDRNRVALHLYSCFWAQLYFLVNPLWRLQVEGREKLPWRGAAVLVSNHESLGDVLVLFGLYRPFKWVSKASVFNLPFLGWNMRLNGYVPIVRGRKESVLEMMADCRRWLSRGMPVLLFPEGTRSPDGVVRAFKDGAFKLAVEEGVPVIPIVLTGTADTLPKHGVVLRTFADCRVRVLDPVDPAPFGGDFAALRDHVRGLVVDARASMRGEPGSAGAARAS
jgi:1-acyl-sn-glycerol-3-phosphate acyltransferase